MQIKFWLRNRDKMQEQRNNTRILSVISTYFRRLQVTPEVSLLQITQVWMNGRFQQRCALDSTLIPISSIQQSLYLYRVAVHIPEGSKEGTVNP